MSHVNDSSSSNPSTIERNLSQVREAIESAARRAGRDPSQIRLIAVSKTKPLELIDQAWAAGQKSFGENYVQEAISKVESRPNYEWHLIGSLQTNKAKQVVGRFALIHSVDRSKLADDLSKAAVSAGVVQDVLVQVNIGDEETKHGASFEDAFKLIKHVATLPGLRLRGIMSLPPLTENEKLARSWFSSLREGLLNWREKLVRENYLNTEQAKLFCELSIGTSSDYEWAILEGATMVRVGTSIFGARDYTKGGQS